MQRPITPDVFSRSICESQILPATSTVTLPKLGTGSVCPHWALRAVGELAAQGPQKTPSTAGSHHSAGRSPHGWPSPQQGSHTPLTIKKGLWAWSNQKHIWPTVLDVGALVYFKGNLIHVFLIHFHLTHQNVALEKLFEILVSYIFSPNFSLFMTYFPNSRNPILPKAKTHSFKFGSKVKTGNDREHPGSPPLHLDS